MKNLTRHVGRLEVVERIESSQSGNPRFRLRVDGFTFVTKPDSAYAYDVSNKEGQQVLVKIGTHYGTCQLEEMVVVREGVKHW